MHRVWHLWTGLLVGMAALLQAGCVTINLPPGPGALEEYKVSGTGKDKVLLIDLSGVISSDNKDSFYTYPGMVATMKEELERAAKDERIKAVVIRINTPGGTVTASDILYHELKAFKTARKVPIVASIMDIGTSGGYYIAAAADTVMAHPSSVTGSIGVIMLTVNARGLLEKVGVEANAVTSGPRKDMGSPFRPMLPEERAIFQGVIDSFYGRFLHVVQEGRPNLPAEHIRKLADGRIYSGEQAKAAGLIDEIGYLDDAIQAAVDAANKRAAEGQAQLDAATKLTAEQRAQLDAATKRADEQTAKFSEADANRLLEAAAAEALRQKLASSQAELTAMTMSLEVERKKAEDTLTLLAAADAAKKGLEADKATALGDADKRAAELAQANALLADQKDLSAEGQRQVALLNQQTASLREQLNSLQGTLDASAAKDAASQVQIENLGANLNSALAQVAVEQKRRADLEEKEKERLQAEAHNLESYRSEFFGQMRAILGDREGVQVVGDRFVFPSEVLFAPGSATLGPEGQEQVARVAQVIREIADQIPPEINWILRVDGHTDKTPVTPGGPFRDNWELSEARALSVVRYMSQVQGLPPERLAATGFGEFQPIDSGDSPEALAKNRRIELKFTER